MNWFKTIEKKSLKNTRPLTLLNMTVKSEILCCIQLSVSLWSELKHACKLPLA